MAGTAKPQLTQLGPYRLIGELGRGAMGVVYRAVNEKLDREVALKVIAPERDLTPEALGRFQREAKAAAQLSDHPGIVGCHDIGEADGRVYFAMDLVEGRSLEQLLDHDSLAVDDTLRLIEEASRAVHYAHEHQILHRDIKPGNILTTTSGAARVADFGLAKTQTADAESMKLTKSGALIGTPAYMAPEQSFGGDIDARADVYALGATLYHALTGETPFPTDSLYSLLAKIQKTDAEPVRRLNADVPVDVETIVAKCLEKDPVRRYQTALELAEDLARARAGDPIKAKPPGMISLVLRKAKRRKGVVIASALGVLGLIVTSAILIPRITSAETEAETAQRRATEAAAEATRLQRMADAAGQRAKLSGRAARESELAASRAAREARAARESSSAKGAAAETDLAEARTLEASAKATLAEAVERQRDALAAEERAQAALAKAERIAQGGAASAAAAGSDRGPQTPWDYLRASAETAIAAMGELRRAGVPDRMARFLPLVERAAAEATIANPESGEPHHWLARAHRTNFDDDAALRALDQAVEKQPALIAARAERIVLGMRRAAALQRAGDTPGATQRSTRMAADLAALEQSGAVAAAVLTTARGMVALAAGDTPGAQAELARALAMPDADAFAANEAMARTLGALERFDDAAVYWGKVLDADAGYLPARLARARFALAAARSDLVANRAHIQQTVADYALVLAATPESIEALAGRARSRHLLASSFALDETVLPDVWNPLFEAALADWSALEGRTPAGVRLFRERGVVAMDWGVFLGRGNRADPSAAFERSVADLNRDVAASAGDAEALLLRGRACFQWADWMRIYHQPDPRPNLDAAKADFEAVLKLDATHVGARSAVADCLIIRATFCEKFGEDPVALLRDACKVYKTLARQNPKEIGAWHGLASAWLWRARHEEGKKRASAKEHKEAIDAWARVIGLDPTDLRALIETGKSWFKIGEQWQDNGKDARQAFEEACAAFEKSLAIAPERNADWIWIGSARRRLAWALGAKHKDSDATFQTAYSEINTALDREQGNAGYWRERGEVSFLWARMLEQRRKKPGDRWKACFDDFAKAVALGQRDDEITKKLKLAEGALAKYGVKK